MRRVIQMLSLAVILGGISVAVNGQSTTKVTAEMPFEFSIGDRSYEPGRYQMRVTRANSSHSVLQLMNDKGEVIHAILVRKDDVKKAAKSSLQFDVKGDRRSLSSLRTGDHQYQLLM